MNLVFFLTCSFFLKKSLLPCPAFKKKAFFSFKDSYKKSSLLLFRDVLRVESLLLCGGVRDEPSEGGTYFIGLLRLEFLKRKATEPFPLPLKAKSGLCFAFRFATLPKEKGKRKRKRQGRKLR